MQPLPERRQSVKDVDPTKEAAREAIRQAVQRLLAEQGRGGEQWLQERLRQQQIQVRYTHDKGGVLRGVSFELNEVAVKGQEVGYRGAELRAALQGVPAQVKDKHRGQEPKLPALTEQKKQVQKKGPRL